MPELSWPDPDRRLPLAPLGGFSGLYLLVLHTHTCNQLPPQEHEFESSSCLYSNVFSFRTCIGEISGEINGHVRGYRVYPVVEEEEEEGKVGVRQPLVSGSRGRNWTSGSADQRLPDFGML